MKEHRKPEFSEVIEVIVVETPGQHRDRYYKEHFKAINQPDGTLEIWRVWLIKDGGTEDEKRVKTYSQVGWHTLSTEYKQYNPQAGIQIAFPDYDG